jgi:hypothetical protein
MCRLIVAMLLLASFTASAQDIQRRVLADMKAAGYQIERKDSAHVIVTKPANMYEDTDFKVNLFFVSLGSKEMINVAALVNHYYYSDTNIVGYIGSALRANVVSTCGYYFTYDYPDQESPSVGLFCAHEILVSCYEPKMLTGLIECMRSKVERWNQSMTSDFASQNSPIVPKALLDGVKARLKK